MIDKIGGRKAAATLVVLLLGVGVVALKGDIPPNMLALLQVVFGAFVAGNAAEHAAGAIQASKTASSETQVIDALTEVNAQNQQIQESIAQTQQGILAILQIATGQKKP